MNNPIEQLDRLYSSLSMADKLSRKMRLNAEWENVKTAYQHLMRLYAIRGYLLPEEANAVNQLQQILQWIHVQKIQADSDLYNEMAMHVAKMMVMH